MSVLYGALGLLVVAAIAMAMIQGAKWSTCAQCGKGFKRKRVPPEQSTEPGSNAEPSMFDAFAPKRSALAFCSDQCRKEYEDNQLVLCKYDRKREFRKKDAPDTFPYCSEKCRNDANASEGIKEERKRIIRE
jgi:hypothetical protein